MGLRARREVSFAVWGGLARVRLTEERVGIARAAKHAVAAEDCM